MTAADAGAYWFSECTKCAKHFRDAPDTAGVCPHCGHENHYDEES